MRSAARAAARVDQIREVTKGEKCTLVLDTLLDGDEEQDVPRPRVVPVFVALAHDLRRARELLCPDMADCRLRFVSGGNTPACAWNEPSGSTSPP
jgi:hypothetical protein